MKKTTLKEFLNVITESEVTKIVENSDFHDIINANIGDVAGDISKNIEAAIERITGKLRTWALQNLQDANKTGEDPTMYKKIINSPEAAARQIVVTHFKNMVSQGLIPKDKTPTLINADDLNQYF